MKHGNDATSFILTTVMHKPSRREGHKNHADEENNGRNKL
jgi:hypothetical protein